MFDIQRFDGSTTWTLTQETSDSSTTYKLTADGKEDITNVDLKEVLSSNSIATGDTIQLGDNIALDTSGDAYTEFKQTGKNVTLDLNGKTFTAAKGLDLYGNITIKDSIGDGKISTTMWGLWVNSNSTLTLESGTINAGSLGVAIDGGGTFTMNGGSIVADSSNTDTSNPQKESNSDEYYVWGAQGVNIGSGTDGNGATFIMNGGSITTKLPNNYSGTGTQQDPEIADQGVAIWAYGTFKMSGGEIHVNNYFALTGNGSESGNNYGGHTTIEISGGSITSENEPCIYHPQIDDSTLTISGGTITGSTGVEVRAGTINVTGGTITGTGDPYEVDANGNGSTTNGAGIAIAQHTTQKAVNVNISGYNTKISGVNALVFANPQYNTENDSNKVSATISGGTFESTATTTGTISGNAILSNNANVDITVNDGTFDGNVTVVKAKTTITTGSSTTEHTTNTSLKMNGGTTTGAVTVLEKEETVTKTDSSNITVTNPGTETEATSPEAKQSLQITGGTYTSSNSNVTNYLSTDVQQNSDGSVVNKGVGWTAREESENKYFDYIVSANGSAATLLAVSLSTALTEADSLNYLKADSSNRVLGVQSNTANSITDSNFSTDTNDALTGKYSWLTFTTGTNAISISPQTDGVKIKGTGFIGTSTTSLTAAGADKAIYVDATDNSLNNITGGTLGDTLIAGARNTTLDGGSGDDLLVGGTKADLFVYSAGKDVIDGYGTGDQVSLSGSQSFVTNLDSLKSAGETFTLHFDNDNALTFKNAATAVDVTKDGSTYTYIKNAIMHDRVASLTAETTAFDATDYSTIVSINGSAATSGIKITGNSNGNYMLATSNNDTFVGGSGNDTFAYSGGSDTITDFGTGDIVSLDSGFTAPTTFDTAKYDGSDYILSLGSGTDSLTFKFTNAFSLTDGNDTYSYAPGSIAKKTTGGTGDGITIGSSYYTANRFNGVSSDNSSYITIDAEAVNHAIRITGNDNANLIVGSEFGGTLLGGDKGDTLDASKVTETTIGTFLNGGDGADSLVGGAGNDTFVYTGGNDTIKGFNTTQDLVSVASGVDVAAISVSTANSDADLVLNFDNEKLTFEGGASFSSAISLKSGRRDYLLSKGSIAQGKSVTLTADYTNGQAFKAEDKYDTINASLVTSAITIEGNDNANYIVGGSGGSSLSGGKENDTLVGGDGVDIFRYTAGNDVIVDFDSTKDKLDIDTPETKITKARASSRRLTFTMQDKGTLAFRSDDSAPAVVSLSGDTGYLTVDGVVKSNTLKLFSSAKGKIDLKDDSLYSGITTVVADSVKSQSVTLVGGTGNGSFTFAANKKRDGFEYNGGKVTIGNYESGKDRINLGSASISGFSIVNTNDVMISLDGSADKYISLSGGKNDEVLIHQNSVNKGSNSYSKMVFATDGVMYDKAKATSATLWSNAGSYDVADMTVKSTLKKIKLGEGVNGISITAGDKNMVIDASLAGGVILVSGSKNDKFIGSSKSDMFVYNAGKDIIQDFNIGGETDQISLSGSNAGNLSSAKITAGKKSVKFKFGTKDVLTVKPTKGSTLSSSLTVNGESQTFGKNSIADTTGHVSLTSKFGGTYNIEKINKSTSSSYNYIDGKLVEKKLTFKGTTAAESLIGGGNSSSKTLFKGGGGADSLVGGASKDTFFYAKGDTGTATIANFDFNNDKLKIAGGTIAKNGITSLESGGVQFAMKEGKGKDAAAVGWFNVASSIAAGGSGTADTIDASKVAIKANNTYYWFAKEDITEQVTVGGESSTVTIDAGELITWSDKKVSKSDISDYSVIELNYATNLVKASVATAVSSTLDGAKLK